MLRLVIEDDEGKTTVVPLIRDEITIGRKDGNTIRLTERNVSRRHARILRAGEDDATVLLEDLDAYNGVRLNGDRIVGRCTVKPGDLIQIGDYSLALRQDSAGRDAAHPETRPPHGIEAARTEVHHIDSERLPPSEQVKLVVVSSNLAGQTFALTQREVILGRTDENDVVVNHRSISRNHAKIIIRDGQTTILDLASANGVRVNSESYGHASLVNGDIIELGHVKLRFVGPGDDYVFNPADIDDVAVGKGPGITRYVIIGLILLAVAVAAFLATRPKGEAPAPPPSKPSSAVPDNSAVAQVDVEALLNEGRASLKARKWREAANLFDRVLQADAQNAEAATLKQQAVAEEKTQGRFDKIVKDMEERQWADAFFGLADIPPDSVFAPEAAAHRPKLETAFADAELERGLLLIKDKNLNGAKEVLTGLEQKPFAAKQAAKLKDALTPRDVPEAVPEPKRSVKPEVAKATVPPKPVDEPEEPEDEDPEPVPAEDYATVLSQARTYLGKGQRTEAARLFSKASQLRPSEKDPHSSLCVVLERLGRKPEALEHCKVWLAKETNAGQKANISKTIQRLEDELN